MTVEELLKLMGADISNTESTLGNQLKADLAHKRHSIDFNKLIEELTAEDKYHIGRSLIMPGFKRRIFTSDDLSNIMDIMITRVTSSPMASPEATNEEINEYVRNMGR